MLNTNPSAYTPESGTGASECKPDYGKFKPERVGADAIKNRGMIQTPADDE